MNTVYFYDSEGNVVNQVGVYLDEKKDGTTTLDYVDRYLTDHSGLKILMVDGTQFIEPENIKGYKVIDGSLVKV